MVEPLTVEPRGGVRDAIVEAAARLLREQGVQAMTTRGVAHAAGVQAPTIYRLFGDKDGLVDAVADHVMATYVAAKSRVAAESEDPMADLRAGWQMHVDFGLANPDLYALLATSARRARTAATEAGIEVLRGRVRRLARAGRLRVDEERAVQMIHAAGNGAVLALLGTPAHERDPGLTDAMFDAVAAAILTDGPVAPAGDATAVAVTFAAVLPELPSLTAAERGLMVEWIARTIAGRS